MFNSDSQKYVRATIVMVDGSTFTGEIGCGLTAKLENALNTPSLFVELIDAEGKKRFVSKSQIITAEAHPAAKLSRAPASDEAAAKEAAQQAVA